jgi:hypothetical protein
MKKRTSARFLDSRFLLLGMVGLPAPISSELMYAV